MIGMDVKLKATDVREEMEEKRKGNELMMMDATNAGRDWWMDGPAAMVTACSANEARVRVTVMDLLLLLLLLSFSATAD